MAVASQRLQGGESRVGESSRKRSAASWADLAAALDGALNAAGIPFPLADPASLYFRVPEDYRPIALLPLAYMSGDFRKVKDSFYQLANNEALRLVAAAYALPGAIDSGDWQLYEDVESWLRGYLDPEVPASVRSFVEYTLAAPYIGARSIDQIASWIKQGDWSSLAPITRFDAARQRADYFEVVRDFDSMLETAQMASHLAGLIVDDGESSLTQITLRIRVALAHEHLGNHEAAREAMLDAMNLALPHGYVVPFAEVSANAIGLVESLLKTHFPQLLDVYLDAAEQIARNWVIFRFQRLRQDNEAWTSIRELGIQELEITFAACLGETNADIARRFHLAEGTVKNKMRVIYEKLGINSKRPRTELLQMLWGDV